MLELTPLFFALAIPGVIFAGISKGGFGSGASFAPTPLLALILEPEVALALMLPLLMLIDVASLPPYWRRWSSRDSRLLLIGGLPGVVVGAAVFSYADAAILKALIGGLALAFVGSQLLGNGLRPRSVRPYAPHIGVVAGAVAGFATCVSHAGGPPAAVYLLSRGLDKTTYQATTVLVFWVLNIAKAAAYTTLGLLTLDTLWANMLLAPFAILGTWIGVRAHHRLPERAFFIVTYVLLTVTGTKLVFDAIQ
ncbi:MAG: sulfite exporter TauE/SafE family protein [Pseudomonadota bacterium]